MHFVSPPGLTWDRMSEKNLRPVAHRLPDSLQLLGALVTLPPRCSSRRALEITFLKFGKRHFNFPYEIRGGRGDKIKGRRGIGRRRRRNILFKPPPFFLSHS